MENIRDYIEEIQKTKNGNYDLIKERVSSPKKIDLLHACIGLTTEVGELNDAVKRNIFYGKELDLVNLEEEFGDILWYYMLGMSSLDLDFEKIINKNVEKLRARYGNSFSEDKAINRDLKIEREILENK